jgi:hypothetical protein
MRAITVLSSIHRLILIGMLAGMLGILAVGAVTYWRGIPENEIWISDTTPSRPWRAAMIRGTLHVVVMGTGGKLAPPTGIRKSAQWGPFYVRSLNIGSIQSRGFGVPFWALGLLFAFYPSLALITGPIRRRRRRRRGLCLRCGYNLTGLPEPRCPECGTAFQT